MNGHQNGAFSSLIGALKSHRKVNGYGADYAVKEMKEIFGDNKIMYQFSEVIDTGILRMFLKSKTSVETCDSGGRGWLLSMKNV